MTTKNKAEGWVIALVVMGVLFIAFGIYNWQAGLDKEEEIFPQGSTFPEDWTITKDTMWRDAHSQTLSGKWMVGLGSILTIAGGISLTRKKKE